MKKYEMEFCVHIVKQIYELFSRLCKDSSDIPQYRIICNFESNEGINSYEFENFQYKGCTIGIRVISYNKIDTESRFDKIEEVSLEDIEYKYEFIEYNASNCCALTIIFDTLHIPYETHFFNYVLSAYFITKKIVIKKWLDNLENRKKSKSIFDFYNRSIFRKLSCGYETEFIISRAVMDYFYVCYGIDINLITALSCEAYEGNSNVCSVYIPRKYVGRGKRSNGLTFKINERIDFNFHEIRRIRKYMEIATDQLNIVLDANKKIIGYTDRSPNKYEGKLVIDGMLTWKFYIGNLELEYSTGVYRINNKNKKENAKIDLHRIPFVLPNRQMEIISKIICKAQEQTHGTTIVFGERNQIIYETKRLASYNRCIQISPTNLIKKMNTLLNITAIDGAVLADFNGQCYAIGAIFDGDMAIKGNMERGARYNSTVNYIERQKEKGCVFLAAIISEDRTIDIYPNY